MMKSDLSDFYYNMRVPAWMAPWFAIPEVPGAVIGRPDLPSVNLGFGVLPMGASHAVFLAQEAHVELLRRAGLPMDRRLADGAALLDAGAFFVVQIDDLVLCAATEEEARDTARWLDLALRAYEAAERQYEPAAGPDAVRAYNHELVVSGTESIASSLGWELPVSAEMTGSIRAVRIPHTESATREDANALHDYLADVHHIEALVQPHEGLWLRASAQVYNDRGDFAALLAALQSWDSCRTG